jgi:uncharacterized protein
MGFQAASPRPSTSWEDRLFHFARGHLGAARSSHNWEHTLRVLRLCMRIGREETADLEILRPAAILHDIGRSFQDASHGKVCHAAKGCELAAPFLATLPLTKSRQSNILHCIGTHRYRGGQVPQTLEARVLFDADKLDAIGAVGIARAFLFAGEVGARLHNPDVDVAVTRAYSIEDTGYREYELKLRKIKDRMMTPTGKRMAADRHVFMADFFERFLAEYDGKR